MKATLDIKKNLEINKYVSNSNYNKALIQT